MLRVLGYCYRTPVLAKMGVTGQKTGRGPVHLVKELGFD